MKVRRRARPAESVERSSSAAAARVTEDATDVATEERIGHVAHLVGGEDAIPVSERMRGARAIDAAYIGERLTRGLLQRAAVFVVSFPGDRHVYPRIVLTRELSGGQRYTSVVRLEHSAAFAELLAEAISVASDMDRR